MILSVGENKGIIVDTRDVLAGDMERADVATAIAKLLVTDLVTNKVMFSIINKPGKSPNDQGWYHSLCFSGLTTFLIPDHLISHFLFLFCYHSLFQDWGKLFSLFTVPEEELKFTRQS